MIKRLAPSVTITDNTSEVFCVKFAPDGKLLAAGCGDGTVKVYNTQNGKLAYTLQTSSGKGLPLPVTVLRFRPLNAATKTKNVLVAANAEGAVQHWHITSSKCLHNSEEPDNQVYALDYQADGTQFATGGKDCIVRLYDEATKSIVSKLKGGNGMATAGHSNRIFSLRFAPQDPHLIISGGWDNTLQFWDSRVGYSIRSIYGPHICGDALDISNSSILTGSWRPENPLEIWDFSTGKLVEAVQWHQSALKGDPCMLYAAQFNKGDAKLLAAGGSGANEAKVFDRTRNNKLVGTITGLARGVFTVDWSQDNKLAVGGGDTVIRIIDVVELKGGDAPSDRPTTPSIRNAPLDLQTPR